MYIRILWNHLSAFAPYSLHLLHSHPHSHLDNSLLIISSSSALPPSFTSHMSSPISTLPSHLIRQASTSLLCCVQPLTPVLSHWPVLSPSHRTLCLYLPGSLTAPGRPPPLTPTPWEETACPSGTLLWQPAPHSTTTIISLETTTKTLTKSFSSFCKLSIVLYSFYSSSLTSSFFSFWPPQYVFTSFSFLLLLTLTEHTFSSCWGTDKKKSVISVVVTVLLEEYCKKYKKYRKWNGLIKLLKIKWWWKKHMKSQRIKNDIFPELCHLLRTSFTFLGLFQ